MSLSLNSNTVAPKITFNTSKLAQGLSVNLSKQNPTLKRVAVKISWVGDDLDISAVCKGVDGKALLRPITVVYKGRTEVVPKDLIFYMNLAQAGIKHGGDIVSSGELEEEQILVAVSDLDLSIKSVDFIVTSHVENGAGLQFKDIRNMTAQLVDLDSNEVIYTTDLDSAYINTQTGAVFAEISCKEGEWSYVTKTQGLGNHPQGTQNTLSYYYA